MGNIVEIKELFKTIDKDEILCPDFDSFRYKKTLMKGVAIEFHQGEIGIIFLYTFFYIRNISYKRNFIHLYRINYIKILF